MKTLFFKSLQTSLFSLSLTSFAVASQNPLDDAETTNHYSNLPHEVRFKIHTQLWNQGDIKSLLNLRTSKEEDTAVTDFICDAVILSRTQACENLENYNQLAQFFDQGGKLRDDLEAYLKNNSVVMHKDSVLGHILNHVKTNTFQTPVALDDSGFADYYSDLARELRLDAPEVHFGIYQPLWDQGDTQTILNLRINKEKAESVHAFIWDAVLKSSTQEYENLENYNQLVQFFDQGGRLYNDLKAYLQNNAVVMHKDSVLSHILSHVKINAFQTQMIMGDENLSQALYQAVWGSPMEAASDSNYFRNKSILQHLAAASPFKVLNPNSQALSVQDVDEVTPQLLTLKAERTYLSLEEALELAKTETGISAKNTFLTMSDRELRGLRDAAKKQAFESLLAQNPELPLLLDVGPSFVDSNGVLSINFFELPQNLRHLILTNATGNATKIRGWFLAKAQSLISFAAAGLPNVTKIGNGFLSDARSLTSCDISGLRNVTSIGTWFLGHARSLESFDASGLSKVTSIDTWFLLGTKVNGEKIREEILAKENQ